MSQENANEHQTSANEDDCPLKTNPNAEGNEAILTDEETLHRAMVRAMREGRLIRDRRH